MKIVQINAVVYGSTGRIMFGLADAILAAGHTTLCTTGFTWKQCTRPDYVMTSNIIEKQLHTVLSKITGKIGCYSYFATRRLLKKLRSFSPDVLHLHNLHGWYLNLPMLFDYIRKNNIRVIWTFHDCWAFTGCCAHFDMIGCEKWKATCCTCPQYREYPQSYRDNSQKMHQSKKKWFLGVEDLTIVTPSAWMQDLVKQSFLKEYPTRVIHNGIDLTVFTPTESDFREKYGCKEQYILLGVAYAWTVQKGLDVFLQMADRLDENYRIVLVGVDEEIQKKIPPKIIPIRRTQSQQELAQIYSAADLFVNPTREDTFPTVNMEALACGTPVLTFDTGGSAEILDDTCGVSVPKNAVDQMIAESIRICEEKPFSSDACIRRATEFDGIAKIQEYMELYEVCYDGTTENAAENS